MKTFITLRPLTFFPAVRQIAAAKPYFICDGDPVEIPAQTQVFTTLEEQAPGRWLVVAPFTETLPQAYRFAGIGELKTIES